jgi:hypothetical protein
MAMKETVRSLTMYFLFVGVVAIALGIRDVSKLSELKGLNGGQTFAVYFSIAVSFGLGSAFLAAGASLKKALLGGAGWIKALVLVSGLCVVIDTVAVAATMGEVPGVRTAAMIRGLIGVVIAVYLHFNITRLAAEATGEPRVA